MRHGVSARTMFALTTAAGTLSLAIFATNFGSVIPKAAAQGPASRADLLTSPRASDVVDAGEAFLATLSDEQRAIAQIELTPRLAVRWTNFPGGSNVRNGVFFRDLKPEQVEAALKVARVALGAEGFSRYQEVRAADDVFAKGRGGRGPGGGGRGPGGGPGGGMFEQADANKDGKLSRDEAPEFSATGSPRSTRTKTALSVLKKTRPLASADLGGEAERHKRRVADRVEAAAPTSDLRIT